MSQRYAGGVITANQNANFSGLFTGSNSYLSFAGAAQYAIATSTTPFTVEAWVKPNAAGGLIFSEEYGAPNIVMSCSLAASNDVSQPTGLFPAFGWYNGSAWTTAAASTTPVVLNTWSHVAFVFTGSTSKIYINGVDVTKSSSPTPSTTWGITATNGSNWFIGRRWDTAGSNVYFKGLINNFRFVNGSAVYTSNFAPPTNLTAIPNTVMLTCNGPTFIDGSSYAATITNNNGVIVGTDNPFYIQSSPALGAATPGVWTLSQANTAAAQRSWPMYDPFFNLNTGMIHGNGTNGGTNNTFLDSSSNNFTVTRNGNTTQGSFSPFTKNSGYWSNYFDGTGDYLTLPSNAAFDFGAGDFTIEAWVYVTVAISTINMIIDTRSSDVLVSYSVSISASAKLDFIYGASRITSSSSINSYGWTHVAVSRNSGTIRLFINGILDTNSVSYASAINTSAVPVIGGGRGGAGTAITNYYFNGYISNMRILKGTGLYTTSFTPPNSPLTAITNTSLLTCQSNRFVDNSSNAFLMTPSGDVRTITYSPFYYPLAYTPQSNSGGIFFDGSGDYLTLTGSSNLAFGTNDFTIELFVYFTSIASFQTLYDGRPTGTSTGAYPSLYFDSSSVRIIYAANGAARITSDSAPSTGQWTHVVISRASGTTRMFINGAVQTGTYTDGTTYLNGASRPILGATGDSQNNPLFGFISNVRTLNGTGVTSVTVPTTPLTAVTNTQLLLSGTNASFIDNASNLVIETVNTSISTSQSKYGSGSMSFNGTNTYAKIITLFSNGGRVVQTLGDFTTECWVNPTTVNAQRCIYNVNTNATGYGAVRLDHASGGAVQLLVSSSGSTYAINTTSTYILPTGSWTHLAVVRAGPSIIVYANGSPIITSTAVTITTALVEGTQSLIGALSLSGTLGNYFDGYISDFRATNYARYLGVFTPPTSTLQNQ